MIHGYLFLVQTDNFSYFRQTKPQTDYLKEQSNDIRRQRGPRSARCTRYSHVWSVTITVVATPGRTRILLLSNKVAHEVVSRRRWTVLWGKRFVVIDMGRFYLLLSCNVQSERGGISVETEYTKLKATSRLRISSVGYYDEGSYTCTFPNTISAAIHLIVSECKYYNSIVMNQASQGCKQ